MHSNRTRLALVSLTALLLIAAAGSAAAADSVAHSDASFMKDAAQAGHSEVAGSKLALAKTSDPQVKAFAQQMIDDHTKAAQELQALASAKGVKLPSDESMTQKAKEKMMLSGADGANFDYRYADSIGVSAHQDAVKLFRKASTDAKDPDVKAFASKTLPTLEHHLQMAKELQAATAVKAGKK
jgi:putative membrane protein